MSADEYTIEQALSDYQGSDGEPLNYIDLLVMLAELAELRRKAWNWDEARRITDAGLSGERITVAAMRTTGGELLTFLAGDGDAEWARKAVEAQR